MRSGVAAGRLEPAPLRVSRLAPDGPLLVRWRDRTAGMGHYTIGYYRVLSPAPEDPLLLACDIAPSGGGGALDPLRLGVRAELARLVPAGERPRGKNRRRAKWPLSS